MHKLLLADGSAAVQRILTLTFAAENMQVVAVTDGEQAIARLPVERPDIVLVEIGLATRNGYDVAAFIKGRPDLAHIPVLLLAGAFEPIDSARAEQAQCNGIVLKPFEPPLVVARVRELLKGGTGRAERATADIPRPVDRLTSNATAPPGHQNGDTSAAEAPAAPVSASADAARPAGEPLADRAPAAGGDDYFERLDAALSGRQPLQRQTGPAHADAPPAAGDEVDVPTLESVLTASDYRAAPDAPADQPARLPVYDRLPDWAREALVEDVAQRVIERVSPDAIRSVVSDVVADVAERLIREEIVRIRKMTPP